uniref:Thiopurine S-methyltransferase-like n=1 Tax=Saccoglossus kowalevskii TaxID=10224 RepID=A0ABM0MFC6_SACKO|nr:PREDICTED: thiopurine S-methyltransferase-like [Saccoglossus kowalevskii]
MTEEQTISVCCERTSNPVQKVQSRTVEKWNERWEEGKTSFHLPHVHKLLAEHSKTLINGRKGIKILFPLCGKTMDMKWLADQGHTVIGVEISNIAIQQFFVENNIEYTINHVDGLVKGEVYQQRLTYNKGRSLYNVLNETVTIPTKHEHFQNIKFDQKRIYDIIGQVDAIWDRAAFSAIMPSEREKYRDVIISTMNAYTRYCLIGVDFDPSVKPGPPYHAPEVAVEQTFGAHLTIEKIGEMADLREKWVKMGHKYFTDILFLLSLKA